MGLKIRADAEGSGARNDYQDPHAGVEGSTIGRAQSVAKKKHNRISRRRSVSTEKLTSWNLQRHSAGRSKGEEEKSGSSAKCKVAFNKQHHKASSMPGVIIVQQPQ